MHPACVALEGGILRQPHILYVVWFIQRIPALKFSNKRCSLPCKMVICFIHFTEQMWNLAVLILLSLILVRKRCLLAYLMLVGK